MQQCNRMRIAIIFRGFGKSFECIFYDKHSLPLSKYMWGGTTMVHLNFVRIIMAQKIGGGRKCMQLWATKRSAEKWLWPLSQLSQDVWNATLDPIECTFNRISGISNYSSRSQHHHHHHHHWPNLIRKSHLTLTVRSVWCLLDQTWWLLIRMRVSACRWDEVHLHIQSVSSYACTIKWWDMNIRVIVTIGQSIVIIIITCRLLSMIRTPEHLVCSTYILTLYHQQW